MISEGLSYWKRCLSKLQISEHRYNGVVVGDSCIEVTFRVSTCFGSLTDREYTFLSLKYLHCCSLGTDYTYASSRIVAVHKDPNYVNELRSLLRDVPLEAPECCFKNRSFVLRVLYWYSVLNFKSPFVNLFVFIFKQLKGNGTVNRYLHSMHPVVCHI
jgi:hypothetical protein